MSAPDIGHAHLHVLAIAQSHLGDGQRVQFTVGAKAPAPDLNETSPLRPTAMCGRSGVPASEPPAGREPDARSTREPLTETWNRRRPAGA